MVTTRSTRRGTAVAAEAPSNVENPEAVDQRQESTHTGVARFSATADRGCDQDMTSHPVLSSSVRQRPSKRKSNTNGEFLRSKSGDGDAAKWDVDGRDGPNRSGKSDAADLSILRNTGNGEHTKPPRQDALRLPQQERSGVRGRQITGETASKSTDTASATYACQMNAEKTSSGEFEEQVREYPDAKPKLKAVEDILTVTDEQMSAFIQRDVSISALCRHLLADSYKRQTTVEFAEEEMRRHFLPEKRKGRPRMGPLPHLEIGTAFGCDQLWEELEMRNKPLLAHIQQRLQAIEKEGDTNKRALARFAAGGHASGEEAVVDSKDDGDGNADPVEMDVDDDDRLREGSRLQENTHIVSREDYFENDEGNEYDELSGSHQVRPKEKRVRFDLGDKKRATDASRDLEHVDSLEDGFFTIADMERFAEDAENLAIHGKLMESDDDNEGDGYNLSGKDSEAIDGTQKMKNSRMLYSDFFDPPVNVPSGSASGKVGRAAALLEGRDADEAMPDQGNEVDELDTPLQRERAKQRGTIEAIEDANVARKPWALRGEVSAFSRPKDSLLDSNVEHDMTGRPKTFISSEINASIEDVIKQRVVDGLFDDVVMMLPDEYSRKVDKKNELPEISQEKSTKGLADLYAREYSEEVQRKKRETLASQEVQREQEEETPEQQEVNRLFDKLSTKLDALSSLHFAPLVEEARIEKAPANVKALAAEEAIPEAVSNGTLLAPREVYAVTDDLTGEKELSKGERRSARRRKKSKRRKERAAGQVKRDLVVQADPALAEKRRAVNALVRRGKMVKIAEHVGKNATDGKLDRRGFGIKTPDEIVSEGRVQSAAQLAL